MSKPTNNQEKVAQLVESYKQAVINGNAEKQSIYKKMIVNLVFNLEKKYFDFCNSF